jgi:hypothetical protein
VDTVSEEDAQKIAVDFLKKMKNKEKVDVVSIEQKDAFWIIHGTCPIDLEGHPWSERFEVVIDQKGRVKSSEVSLL